MKILALDTSTEYLSLALQLEGKVYKRDIHAGQSHSQQILPLLRELLDEAGIEFQALDGIAFGAGPGSFTGLRIGCGVAQGLAFGAGLPVIGVSTLMALAENLKSADLPVSAERVVACLDARMGEVYHAAYEWSGQHWDEVSAPGLYKPEAVPALTGEGWVGIGTGWAVYADQLQARYGAQLKEIFVHALIYDHPQAISIARIAAPLFASGQGRPAAEAAPVYIRNKVALKMSERKQVAAV